MLPVCNAITFAHTPTDALFRLDTRCDALRCVVLHYIALHCIVLYCIVLYCIVLYCIVLYCIVLSPACRPPYASLASRSVSELPTPRVKRHSSSYTSRPRGGLSSIPPTSAHAQSSPSADHASRILSSR